MQHPLVSVIVPVYNVLPYLQESLDSLLVQTYPLMEILIIDDGSTDGSGAVCDAYQEKDPRIHVIHQSNKGLSAARNAGLDRMTGDLVAFLDSDDTFLPEMIRLMVNAIEKENADLAVCGYGKLSTQEKMKPEKVSQKNRIMYSEAAVLSSREALNALFLGKLNPAVWNKLYKRELWNTLRFPEGYVYEDSHTTYLVLEQCKRIVFVSQMLVLYRKHRPGSITNSFSEKNIHDYQLVKTRLEGYVKSHTPELFSQEDCERYMKRSLFSLAVACANMMTHATKENQNALKEFYARILQIIEERKKIDRSFKLKVFFAMFYFCPRLIPAALKIYGMYKKCIALGRG